MAGAQTANMTNRDDRYDLSRFIDAQKDVYYNALSELRNGEKRGCWMWFIFPQIDGLGVSAITKRYAIKSKEEAREYLAHPVLGARLLECTETILAFAGRTVSAIFGFPDDLKFKSSMTLFSQVSEADSVFARILDRYFDGEQDMRTLELLQNILG